MIPALRALLARVKPAPPPADAGWLNVWGIDNGIAETALHRLNELAPEEAARHLKHDLASGKPALAAFAVREFPAQQIPEADAALLALFEANSPIAKGRGR